ncbi:MFS transporter [Schaalia canis]|nr:MFS transporter [Schaalia canis]
MSSFPDSDGTRVVSEAPVPAGKISTNPTLRALLVIVFFTYIAQNMLNVSIAPLSRALGLVEWAIGLAVSLAALFVAMLSQFWGRRSTHWGRRSVLLISLTLAFMAGTLFAAAVWAKAIGLIGAVVATAAIVLARGPFFGSAVSAIPPTAQALIAEITPNEQARVRGMSAFSGATNLSIMIGSLVSASLGAWWIYAPVYATPWLVGAALLVAFFAIPVTASRKDLPLPPKMSWTDPRVLPWILSGAGLFFANGVLQIIVGFIVQDRLHLAPQQALTVTGALLLVTAAGAMIAQLLVVPRLVWPPRRLVRVGLSAALVMFVLIALIDSIVVIAIAAFFMGFASGLLGPGYTAGGSLAVGPDEQGAVAGVLHAVGAVTWIFAPVTATTLYGWHPLAPFILAGIFLLASTVVSYVHPLLRARRDGTAA